MSPPYRLLSHLSSLNIHRYVLEGYSLGRYYSTFHPKTAWEAAPLVDIHKFIKGTEQNMPKDACFSILHPDYITRSLQEIKEIYGAIGISSHPIGIKSFERQLKDLVVFRPQRRLLHEIIIQVTTQIQLESDEHFEVLTKAIEKETVKEINDKNPEFEQMRRYYNESAFDAIKDYNFGNSSDSGTEPNETIREIFQTVNNRVKNGTYKPGLYIPNETLKSVISKIFADDLLKKHYLMHVNEIVASQIKEKLKRGDIQSLKVFKEAEREDILIALDRYKNEQRLTYMVAGGPASGKGILTQRLAALLKENNMALRNFAMIAPDRYKLVLQDSKNLGADKSYHGTLTQDECRLIATESRDRIMQMARNNSAPNTFIEMLVPYEDKIELGTYSGGRFRVYIASADPIASVDGSFERFKEKGRFVPKEYVLEGQKRVSAYIPKLITDNRNKNKNIRLEIHDTTNAFHEDSAKYKNPVALIEPADDVVTLFDLTKIFDFIKKTDINPNAENPNKIFSATTSTEELARRLKKDYGQGIIRFVDPSTSITDENIEEKIYAIYDNNTEQLEIKQPAIFNKMMENNLAKTTFQTLDSTVADDYESTITKRQNLDIWPGAPWYRR